MRKTGKALTALLLALALSLSSVSVAWAAESESGTEVLPAAGLEETQEDASQGLLSDLPPSQEGAEEELESPVEETPEEPAQEEGEEESPPQEEVQPDSSFEEGEMTPAEESAGTPGDESGTEKTENQETPVEETEQTPQESTEQESEGDIGIIEGETYFSPMVKLREGQEYAQSNYRRLKRALQRADGVHRLTVRPVNPGTYYVDSTRAIRVRSCTTLDLNGSVLLRSGDMHNLIQVESLNGEQCLPDYTVAKNVVIQNGTLDGDGNVSPGYNLINIGHTDGLEIRNVTFTHGQGTHLLELNGCRNCLITGCTFTGFEAWGYTAMPEAIQLDWSYNSASTTWNGVYSLEGTPGNDCTPCKNITITRCLFKDYPAGVGTHHCLYNGPRIQGVTIKNNVFTNTKNFGSLAPAIWCYGFTNCVVSGNTITGRYSYGMRITGSSVKVKNNIIGTKKEPVAGRAITVSSCKSFVKWKGSKRKTEYCTGGQISGNQIYIARNSKAGAAITVRGSSKLSAITGNTINAPKTNGIYVSDSARVTKINDNKILAPGYAGIHIGSATVPNINGNQIKSGKKNGIEATSQAKMSKVQKNRITGCMGTGIVIANTAIRVTVTRNQLKGNKKPLNVLAQGTIQLK